ncbi:50S ribosomal protein L6 [Candidatus Pacearchaeota archaeon]|nr:50S ribosomal protein L6 [Candidatus Pacearchaeota archaeon]
MKLKFTEKLPLPSDIECSVEGRTITCKKGSLSLSKPISLSSIRAKVEENHLVFECDKANKSHVKVIRSYMAHVRNMIAGLNEPFVYILQAANVHFPMTLKIEGKRLLINNFLGEKKPRIAEIVGNVDVDVKGQVITIRSPDREQAGQTAANIEKATKVRNRDRRVFQDGIYITDKPGRNV